MCRLAILHRGMPHGLHRLLRFYGESLSLQFPADRSERNSQSNSFSTACTFLCAKSPFCVTDIIFSADLSAKNQTFNAGPRAEVRHGFGKNKKNIRELVSECMLQLWILMSRREEHKLP